MLLDFMDVQNTSHNSGDM